MDLDAQVKKEREECQEGLEHQAYRVFLDLGVRLPSHMPLDKLETLVCLDLMEKEVSQVQSEPLAPQAQPPYKGTEVIPDSPDCQEFQGQRGSQEHLGAQEPQEGQDSKEKGVKVASEVFRVCLVSKEIQDILERRDPEEHQVFLVGRDSQERLLTQLFLLLGSLVSLVPTVVLDSVVNQVVLVYLGDKGDKVRRVNLALQAD